MKCPKCGVELQPAADDGVHSYVYGDSGIHGRSSWVDDGKNPPPQILCHKAYQEKAKKLRIDIGD